MTTSAPEAAAQAGGTPAARPASASASSILDSLDDYTSTRAAKAAAAALAKSTAPPAPGTSMDPVDFLNRHYTTESMLVSQLPELRSAVSERMNRLDERISTALQRQSETADVTRRQVADAKLSVASLEKRIRLVQSRASQSEKAVLEITKDMKRLDSAKRHLQRTITTLKRLHMLVHAVEQLRLSALSKPFPDYKTASHLVDATRLLLTHFEAFTHKVEPMRLLAQKVRDIQAELRKGLVRGFRIVGFGLTRALELEEGVVAPASSSEIVPVAASSTSSLLPKPELSSFHLNYDDEDEEQDIEEEEEVGDDEAPAVMPPDVLADGTLFLDALGMESRADFVSCVCEDHLGAYKKLFAPAPAQDEKANSFKIASTSTAPEDKPVYSLDQIERRFAWFRRTLRELDEKFPRVFPPYWNFQYAMTRHFLEMTREHILALLEGTTKDRDSDNATILLKALQKTILFEKEMTAWLQRDYGTVFLVESTDATKAGATAAATPVRGDDGEILEFDESGTAVAASSAQGIRIKYERQKREQQKGRAEEIAAAALDEGRASAEQVPVQHLTGLASTAFDDYMSPYIALEEQSMDEQLVESLSDTAVDTRGELPVYTSSTALFVYIKGSITRCTAMTKGKAFFLLYQAFQDSLRKYATILGGKLPSPFTGSSFVSGLNLAAATFGKQDSSTAASASYKIPTGGEVTVCHVISTCEYCVDTLEALEDLIRDTIDADFKDKVDMTREQEEFHDIIAKSVRVLVSGLANRMESALKEMAATNWSTFDIVGEESSYVRSIHREIEPFVTTARGLVPSSYFRSFCDKFAMAFTNMYYQALIRLKRISEPGSQQLLLDVYNIKTLVMKLPVLERHNEESGYAKKSGAASSSIPPAMFTKMVTKQFKRIECLLKLVGTPSEMLIDVFKVQWVGGSALDLQLVMTLKGMKRPEQAAMLEKFGVDPATALKGATVGVTGASIVTEHVQAFHDRSSDVRAKVNSDLSQMRQKVAGFRTSFR